jgi:deazaflavin-dependent oxidoreductase (nitroreductase family)
MPLPKGLARFNLVVTNRIARQVAGRIAGFAIVEHIGRRSGRPYRTPVNLFRHGDEYVIVLTYGADTQWVRNVMAAGSAEVETRGRRLHLVEPRIARGGVRPYAPAAIRPILRLIDADDVMLLRPG